MKMTKQINKRVIRMGAPSCDRQKWEEAQAIIYFSRQINKAAIAVIPWALPRNEELNVRHRSDVK